MDCCDPLIKSLRFEYLRMEKILLEHEMNFSVCEFKFSGSQVGRRHQIKRKAHQLSYRQFNSS